MSFDVRTYSAAAHFNVAASPTDVFTITGAANTMVRIQQIRVSGLATTAGAVNMSIVKRSAANTGGTSTTLAAVPHNSGDAAAAATVLSYTVNPSGVGALVGAVRAERLTLPLAGTASAGATFDFGIREGKPIILNSATEVLAFNCNGGAPIGTAFSIYVEWTEQ